MSVAILGGDNSLRGKLTKQAANIDQALARLQELDQRYNLRLNTENRFTNLQRSWVALKQEFNGLTQAQSFQKHTVIITNMLEFIRHLANTSNLILASKMDTYYLVDTLVNHLPKLTEDAGQARALGSAVIVAGKFTSENWQRLLGASQRIAEAEKNLLRGVQAVLEENPSLTNRLQQPADKMFLATSTYNASLRNMLEKMK